MKNLPEISMWIYKDLLELPSEETDIYEYKSGNNKLGKMPVLVVEVDGYAFHVNKPKQLERDKMKDTIYKSMEYQL